MGIEHKESLEECQTSPEGIPLTWAREHGIDGFPALPTGTRTATGFQPSWNGSTSRVRRTGFPAHIGDPCRYEKQNIPQHTFAHPRLHRAHLRPLLRQGGRRIFAAPAFATAANQRTFKEDRNALHCGLCSGRRITEAWQAHLERFPSQAKRPVIAHRLIFSMSKEQHDALVAAVINPGRPLRGFRTRPVIHRAVQPAHRNRTGLGWRRVGSETRQKPPWAARPD
jgi:hypothetical protein